MFYNNEIAMVPKTLLYIAIGYLVFCVLVYIFQDKMLFVPERHLDAVPSSVGLDYEEASAPKSFLQLSGGHNDGFYI